MRGRRISELGADASGDVRGEAVPGRVSRTQRLPVQRKPAATYPVPPTARAATAGGHEDPFGMHLLGEPTRVADAGGTDSTSAAAVELELEHLVERGDWQKLRPGAFAEASVAADAHARQRRDGDMPDMTGLGKVSTLDRFAHSMKVLQRIWGSLTLDGRTEAVKVALDQELVAASIPPLEGVTTIPAKKHPASFDYKTWKVTLRREFLEGSTVGDEDAADLCGTLAHEIRHGEQQFLTARVLAAKGQSAAEIHVTLKGLYMPVATQAVARKLKGLAGAELAYARRMHTALVTDRQITDILDQDTGYAELDAARERGATVLEGLRRRPPTVSIEEARATCRELRDRIEDVLLKYKIYRQFPTEADSHDVGAGAKLAFQEIE